MQDSNYDSEIALTLRFRLENTEIAIINQQCFGEILQVGCNCRTDKVTLQKPQIIFKAALRENQNRSEREY